MNNFIQDYLVKLYIPHITWTDIIEIIIIAFVLYNVMVWIKKTKAWVLLRGIIVVALFAIFAYILNLKTILWIAGKTISVGIIALVIIFQPELRKSLGTAWTVKKSFLDCSGSVMEGIKVNGSVVRLLKRL